MIDILCALNSKVAKHLSFQNLGGENRYLFLRIRDPYNAIRLIILIENILEI